MRAYSVMSHELVGDLFCERGIEATTNIDCHQFPMLARVVCSEFASSLVSKSSVMPSR